MLYVILTTSCRNNRSVPLSRRLCKQSAYTITGWSRSRLCRRKGINGANMLYSRLFGLQLVTLSLVAFLHGTDSRLCLGCDALAAIERIIVISFTEAEGDDDSRLSVILNRAYKVSASPLRVRWMHLIPRRRLPDGECTTTPWPFFSNLMYGAIYHSMITCCGQTKSGIFFSFVLVVGMVHSQTYLGARA
jgi:hypothetical protein